MARPPGPGTHNGRASETEFQRHDQVDRFIDERPNPFQLLITHRLELGTIRLSTFSTMWMTREIEVIHRDGHDLRVLQRTSSAYFPLIQCLPACLAFSQVDAYIEIECHAFGEPAPGQKEPVSQSGKAHLPGTSVTTTAATCGFLGIYRRAPSTIAELSHKKAPRPMARGS